MIFLKSQVSAFFGGVTDYLVMLYCVEMLGIHYFYAIGIGGFIGAIVNYTISLYLTNSSSDKRRQVAHIKLNFLQVIHSL